MTSTVVFAAAFATLYAAHQVGDHWIQTDCQAGDKGRPGWKGRLACLRHVATYTATGVVFMVVAAWWLAMPVHLGFFAVGMAVNAVSHYIADRRTPLRKLAAATGHPFFVDLGAPRPGHDDNPSLGTGMYALDQAWHIGFLFLSALIIAGGAA